MSIQIFAMVADCVCLTATEYGSRTFSIGGVTLLKGPHGHTVARTMTQLANKETVTLQVKNGAEIEIAVNQAPKIDGDVVGRTSFGCGSSVGKLFSPHLLKFVDTVMRSNLWKEYLKNLITCIWINSSLELFIKTLSNFSFRKETDSWRIPSITLRKH